MLELCVLEVWVCECWRFKYGGGVYVVEVYTDV